MFARFRKESGAEKHAQGEVLASIASEAQLAATDNQEGSVGRDPEGGGGSPGAEIPSGTTCSPEARTEESASSLQWAESSPGTPPLSGDTEVASVAAEDIAELIADAVQESVRPADEPADAAARAASEPATSWLEELPAELRAEQPRVRGKRLAKPDPTAEKRTFTPAQRLLLLDCWHRSGLPAGDFAPLVGLSQHTLYKWQEHFERLGPEGLMDQPRGARPGRRLPELTQRTILMLKESHPEWGCQRISDLLLRGPALPASASAVARVLHEAGYELVEEPTRAHPEKVRRFERAKPNQLWQTDLFTFLLKRQNRRVYRVAFLDDHSRFLVCYGLHASASTALVLEALEAGIAAYGPPEEILTDNGPQYVTWRGKSRFTRRLEQLGIRQLVARPKPPQTLGKIERFWGTLWREFLETAVFVDLAEARTRIGLFIDYYNFQRVHHGIDGLVPADRFFGAASDVARTLKERVAANALELARHGAPRAPFYVTGQLEGQSFSVHAEGPRLILTRPGQPRQEVELSRPPATATPADGESPVSSSSEAESSLPRPVCPEGSPASVSDTDPPTDSEDSSPESSQEGGEA